MQTISIEVLQLWTKKKYTVGVFYESGNAQKEICNGRDLDDACDILHDYILKEKMENCIVEFKEEKEK